MNDQLAQACLEFSVQVREAGGMVTHLAEDPDDGRFIQVHGVNELGERRRAWISKDLLCEDEWQGPRYIARKLRGTP